MDKLLKSEKASLFPPPYIYKHKINFTARFPNTKQPDTLYLIQDSVIYLLDEVRHLLRLK